jgi:hypothetical protein
MPLGPTPPGREVNAEGAQVGELVSPHERLKGPAKGAGIDVDDNVQCVTIPVQRGTRKRLASTGVNLLNADIFSGLRAVVVVPWAPSS